MSEMIKRVALVIEAARLEWDRSAKTDGLFEPRPGEPWGWSLHLAEAAIKEEREPTEKMKAAGGNEAAGHGNSGDPTPSNDDCGDIWRAMIDAALKDDGGESR